MSLLEPKHRRAGLIVLLSLAFLRADPATAAADWKKDWRVAPGFSIATDTQGYAFPTEIAIVPNPGPGPKDPLYYVAEIRGTIKVVTNDRSIYTFADGIVTSRPPEELPALVAETGMAGLYLEPTHGYVYASFAYRDEANQLRNDIIRFETKPEVFSIEPVGSLSFTEIFAAEASDQSHQIGSMMVHEGHLYVAVGDARRTYRSRDINSTLGKILRMTLDGKPVPDNPFYVDDDPKRPANFVWAYGLRNPFGIEMAEGGLFAVDNGPDVDRFVRIHRGGDYLWDGSDWSMGLRAKAVFAPATGPVRVKYLPPGAAGFPEDLHSRFFMVFGGFLGAPPGAGRFGERSVVTIGYDMEADLAAGSAQPFLQYQGPGLQLPVSIAFGPDALYFAPLLPDVTGETRILRVTHDPENEHPFLIGRDQDARSLMSQKGCMGCHSFDPARTMVGPTLELDQLRARLDNRLGSREYLESLDRLDSLDDAFYVATRPAREAVRSATGNERLRVYIENQILHPRFDDPESQMADLALSEDEAAIMSRYLAGTEEEASLLDLPKALLVRLVPRPKLRHVVFGFAAGALASLAGVLFLALLYRAVRGSRGRHP